MNEISVLQMSHMESFNSLKLTYAEDSKLLTSNYERIIANSNAKIASLESNLTTLQFECNDLNAKLKESMAISQTQSTEILQLKSNLSKELAEKADLIQLNRSLEKEVLKCNSKIDSLMQQIKDKEDYISQSAQLSQADADKCSYLSEKLVNYENMIQVFQSKLETSSQEILKGNSYIQKISSENKMLKEKVERKSEVLRRQVVNVCIKILPFLLIEEIFDVRRRW